MKPLLNAKGLREVVNGPLPLMQIDGLNITDSIAACRYVGQTRGLYPAVTDPKARAPSDGRSHGQVAATAAGCCAWRALSSAPGSRPPYDEANPSPCFQAVIQIEALLTGAQALFQKLIDHHYHKYNLQGGSKAPSNEEDRAKHGTSVGTKITNFFSLVETQYLRSRAKEGGTPDYLIGGACCLCESSRLPDRRCCACGGGLERPGQADVAATFVLFHRLRHQPDLPYCREAHDCRPLCLPLSIGCRDAGVLAWCKHPHPDTACGLYPPNKAMPVHQHCTAQAALQ